MKKLLVLMALVMSVGFTNAQNIQQIREKADKGDAYSQYLMGYSYNNGINGAVIDYAQARSWFKRSAENGYGAAAYFMGWYYYYGEGVTKNIPEALKWFTKAQNLGMTDKIEELMILIKVHLLFLNWLPILYSLLIPMEIMQ